MTKFETVFREALEEHGTIGSDWRLQILEREKLGQSDYEVINFRAYPPRKRNPYGGSVRINFVKGLIYWNTLSVTGDRSRYLKVM